MASLPNIFARKRFLVVAVGLVLFFCAAFRNTGPRGLSAPLAEGGVGKSTGWNLRQEAPFNWAKLPLRHPLAADELHKLPTPAPGSIRRIQHSFAGKHESKERKQQRLQRLAAVKANFTHAWNGYRTNAWLHDELRPLSGRALDPFGGWAATLVDSLDTLWIMGMKPQFEEAVKAVGSIDFSSTSQEEINVFETTIRYLGGLLGAYDVSGRNYSVLLRKAKELGEMIYHAFDTPNHMPMTRWIPNLARSGSPAARHEAYDRALLAELGSFGLEFVRLSQLTGDHKYYDAIQRIMNVMEEQQDMTNIPGLWAVQIDAKNLNLTVDSYFTIGGMADSAYEYIPKTFLLLGGGSNQYRDVYVKALAAMKQHIFYQPMTQHSFNILIPGNAYADGHSGPRDLNIEPEAQHLGCFAGGMVGLAARAFDVEQDMSTAKALVEGCLWGYESSPNGIMPEIMHTTVCPKSEAHSGPDMDHDDRDGLCRFEEAVWHKAVAEENAPPDSSSSTAETMQVPPAERIASQRLVPGVTSYKDKRYILRPEAIESVFLLYRMTGDNTLQDRAWDMFTSIISLTQTDYAHAALDNVVAPNAADSKTDRMESFWLAETLKYFYLIFEDTDKISLDEYVLNTEAHPLRWRSSAPS